MPLPVTHHGSGLHEKFVEPRGTRMALPLGPVDRDSGVFHTPRGATRDLRNLLLRDGTAHLRKGMASTTGSGAFVAPNGEILPNILGIQYLPIENSTLVVAHGDAGVFVFKTAGDGVGTDPEYIGKWFDWSEADMPIVTMAESANKVFMAHSDAVQDRRAATFVYSPQGGLPVHGSYGERFGPLLATWNTRGTADPADTSDVIKFRGVVSYMDYLVGWGWGDNLDKRPEIVRISLPGEPIFGSGKTDRNGNSIAGKAGFDPGHWVIAGSRGAPVTACAPAGNVLLIMKASETYPLVGSSPATFGVGQAVDHNFGCIGPNLWVNINGRLFVWSHEGPKVTTGGPLEDTALPLDLDGPPPDSSDFVHEGGFGIYIPRTRVLLFVFDSWVYALDTGGGPGGWTYWDMGVALRAGEVLYEGAVAAILMPPAGPWVNSVTAQGDTTIDVSLDVTDATGGNIQIWYRPQETTEWTRATADEVAAPDNRTANPVVTEQTVQITGLEFATQYELAFRYDNEGMVHKSDTYDYTGAQGTWPAASRVMTSTAGGSMAAWSRTSDTREIITLTFLEHDVSGDVLYKSTDGGETWTQIASDVGSPYEYEVQAGENETEMDFKVEYPAQGTVETGRVWVGPAKPTSVEQLFVTAMDPEWYKYRVRWNTGYEGARTRVQDNYLDNTYQHRVLEVAGVEETPYIDVEKNSEKFDDGSGIEFIFTAQVRHEITQFGRQDQSEWVYINVHVRIADDENAHTGGSGGGGTGGEV